MLHLSESTGFGFQVSGGITCSANATFPLTPWFTLILDPVRKARVFTDDCKVSRNIEQKVTKKTKNEGDGKENASAFFPISFVPFVSFCSNLLIAGATQSVSLFQSFRIASG
jgi:hypothetical protein